MTDLGLILIEVAGRVTLLALAAVVLSKMTARRGPGNGAAAALAGLLGCVALTFLALVPLPDWWTWPSAPSLPAPPGETSKEDTLTSLATESTTVSEHAGVHLTDVLALARSSWRHIKEPTGTFWTWPAVWAVVFLSGAGLSLGQVLLGLWAVQRWRQRARPIPEDLPAQLLQELSAALSCRRIKVRESVDVQGPATVGWRRPLVLLPGDWRCWTEGELRAVLAHEAAHVARADYLAGAVACLGVALHFYHPLVHWLAGRLFLEQELAADALAAPCAGGQRPYLRALARLALRPDAPSSTWPVRTFLSAGRTLMRRIQMLRTKEGLEVRSPSWLARVLMLGFLGAVVLATSALRGPAETPPPSPQAAATKETAEAVKAEGTPFDLSAVPEDSLGIYAISPSRILALPGMKKYAEDVDTVMAAISKTLGMPDVGPLSVADIEQVVGTLDTDTNFIQVRQSELKLDVRLIRTVKDYDWEKTLAALFPKAKEVRLEGGVYFKVTREDCPSWACFGFVKDVPVCCAIPDRRTVFFSSEDEVVARLKGKAQTSRPWAKDWKTVERDLFAVVLDLRDKAFQHDRRKLEKDVPPEIVDLIEKANSMVFGMTDKDGLAGSASIRFAPAYGFGEIQQAFQALVALLRTQLPKAEKAGKESAGEAFLIRELLKGTLNVIAPSSDEIPHADYRYQSRLRLAEVIEKMMENASEQ